MYGTVYSRFPGPDSLYYHGARPGLQSSHRESPPRVSEPARSPLPDPQRCSRPLVWGWGGETVSGLSAWLLLLHPLLVLACRALLKGSLALPFSASSSFSLSSYSLRSQPRTFHALSAPLLSPVHLHAITAWSEPVSKTTRRILHFSHSRLVAWSVRARLMIQAWFCIHYRTSGCQTDSESSENAAA